MTRLRRTGRGCSRSASPGPVPRDLGIARQQMELSLGWHIIVASLGIGLPAMILIVEWLHLRTGEPVYDRISGTWARALGILFAVGAVSGTVLSFEFGALWPGLIGSFGDVIGLPKGRGALRASPASAPGAAGCS